MTGPRARDEGVELMLRVQRGDMSAFTELVDVYQHNVVSMVSRLVKDRVLAEDLAQEVFLKIFRARERYRPLSKFSTWLYRITYNCALNAIQARDRSTVLSIDALGEDGEAPARLPAARQPGPAEEVASEELHRAVESILDRLPINQRMAVELHKYHGMAYRDIAEAIGCTELAVKSLLARARQSIKQKLAPYLREKVV
ncbi:MAG: sigma-70 family RNA polymerase sigma factor [Planctomycetota bacterium]